MCRTYTQTFIRAYRGFTLLELLVTLVILSIVLGAGVPMMLNLAKSMRLQGAAQDTYALLQYARTDALRTGENRFVVWDSKDGSWCAAVTNDQNCDCMEDDCSINGVLRQIHSDDYNDIAVAPSFASDSDSTRFDGMRGLAMGNNGHVALKMMDDDTTLAEVRLVVSTLGRIRYCRQSGEVGDYPAC
ncbi:prepilin-type cleavage/methylation domain-containing protein [Pseudidiomarina sediminum]|uniref:Type II secretion system protein H n=2 Tax=Pseudidiomarina sediminum TaxID=431675 RepID=A0A432Z944_9GAMM|nr:prepilin-type cleavage/methylation domain-containing protein [Pseudidiomarina sediminum]